MARQPRTSAASYALFKNSAWQVLSDPDVRGLTVGQQANEVYRRSYSEPLDANVPAKQPLIRRNLYRSMVTLFDNANGQRIEVQDGGAWPQLTAAHRDEYQDWVDFLGHWAITRFLCGCFIAQPNNLSATAAAATEAYLHVYPNPQRNLAANWRVALNIRPESIAAAVGAVLPVMNQNNDIDHFKVTAPGYAGKPDSLIVYMVKNNGTYNNIRQALTGAVANLAIQETFNPLWNEFALGQAEASEPPTINYTVQQNPEVEYSSFGMYRSQLTAMAFQRAVAAANGQNPANVAQNAFNNALDTILPEYGVPLANPHEQQALNFQPNDALNAEFMRAYGDLQVVDGVLGNGQGDAYVQAQAVLTT